VKTTSPRRSDRILGIASGAVARRSDRIIDWPVNVIVTSDCAQAGAHASSTNAIHTRDDSLIGTLSCDPVIAVDSSRADWLFRPAAA
jgi:hypothetical protein